MTNTIIREADKSDIDQLQILLSELGYEVSTIDLLYRMEHAFSHSVIFVAVQRDHIVGLIQGQVNIRLAEGKYGEIVALVVKSGSRGTGIGKKLLSMLVDHLRELGCETYIVRANVLRQEAHRFYLSQGFEETKIQKVFKRRT